MAEQRNVILRATYEYWCATRLHFGTRIFCFCACFISFCVRAYACAREFEFYVAGVHGKTMTLVRYVTFSRCRRKERRKRGKGAHVCMTWSTSLMTTPCFRDSLALRIYDESRRHTLGMHQTVCTMCPATGLKSAYLTEKHTSSLSRPLINTPIVLPPTTPGAIPPDIEGLTALRELHINYNGITGEINPEAFASLAVER